ncbi:MAG: NAD(P)/FAD-dependent oxidoreductase [Planctomycetota bacterium]
MPEQQPHVVIIGGGFGGLTAARTLRRAPVRLTMIDRRNHHLFQPLLYQVATAVLNPADIAYPIRSALRRQANATVLLAEAEHVDPERRRVQMDSGSIAYDYLILACGAGVSYFGREQWAAVAPGLKSIEDALDIRRRILLAFEAAERCAEDSERQEWLTFVVIGGGPTGVEMAGAIAELAHHTLGPDFRRVDPARARVVLIEGMPRILETYPERLSESAQHQLQELGVELRLGNLASEIDTGGVTVGDERIPSRTVIWGAGVGATGLTRALPGEHDPAGKIKVDSQLCVPGHEEVFAIGDMAYAESAGEPVPGVAPAAVQGGKHAAACIAADLAGRQRPTFRYVDRGSLATIGRHRAVGQLPWFQLTGFPAWLFWGLVHIALLIGFRTRMLVMINWMWNWLTHRRGARLITGAGEDRLPRNPIHHQEDGASAETAAHDKSS